MYFIGSRFWLCRYVRAHLKRYEAEEAYHGGVERVQLPLSPFNHRLLVCSAPRASRQAVVALSRLDLRDPSFDLGGLVGLCGLFAGHCRWSISSPGAT